LSLIVSARERALPLALSATLPVRAAYQGRFPFRQLEAIERAQRRRLRATVAHAHRHVPYYRETMRRRGLDPGDVATAADLAKLPVIERADLQRDPEYFCSERHPPSECLQLRSGGSTGEPVTVFWDRSAIVIAAAHGERRRRVIMTAAGRRVRAREVGIGPRGARPGAARTGHRPGPSAAAVFSRSSLVPASVRVKRERLSLFDPPAENLPRINELLPDVIATYGSYVEALFAHMLGTGERLRGSPVIVFGADPLSESMRARISGEFGLEVLAHYQAVETPMIGFECERGTGFHHNLDLCAVRVLGGSGKDLPPGSPGEAVVSNLVGRGTVLLNYRLGDIVAMLPEPCPCGRSLPLLSLESRADEWIETADGSRLHPQTVRGALSAVPGLLRYQVVQLAPGRLEVPIVPEPRADLERVRRAVEDALKAHLGPDASLAIAFVDTLPRSAAGKVRPVVLSLEARRQLDGTRPPEGTAATEGC
jgi:phenylacetate-CoA ligase